jgi:outer membrane immunogenic protein
MSGSTVSSLLALVALPAVAFAADPLSQKGPPAAPALIYSWNGVYLGSQFGYSFNEVSEQATDMTPGYLGASGVFPSLANPVFDAQSYLSKGLFTGVHVGYNKQYGSLVVGTEADVDFAGMHRAGTQFNMLALGLGGPYGVNIQDNFRPYVATATIA